jgi:hypothetical protein
MTPEEFQLAALELRERATQNAGTQVGGRCNALADALDSFAWRIPYAWEVTQGARSFILSAEEFAGKTYEGAVFIPLYRN